MRRIGLVAGTATRCRLWLAKDHLLCVDSAYYSENYKRFYFRDIQAFVIRKTIYGKVVNVVLAVIGLLMLAIGLLAGDGALFVFGIISGFFWGIMVVNALMGPTCVCQVKTAVQTEELPSLGRLGRARKVLARLRPLIAQAQEELVPEQAPIPMGELIPEPTATEASNAAPPVIGQGTDIAPPSGV